MVFYFARFGLGKVEILQTNGRESENEYLSAGCLACRDLGLSKPLNGLNNSYIVHNIMQVYEVSGACVEC